MAAEVAGELSEDRRRVRSEGSEVVVRGKDEGEMIEKICIGIRFVGEAVIVYLVYTETGPWTCLFAVLATFAIELNTYLIIREK